jgi:hypothetical protein
MLQEMFSEEEIARFSRQWAAAVEAPSRSLSEEEVGRRWRDATAFSPPSEGDVTTDDD